MFLEGKDLLQDILQFLDSSPLVKDLQILKLKLLICYLSQASLLAIIRELIQTQLVQITSIPLQ